MKSLDEICAQVTSEEQQRSYVLTDPKLANNPIVFVNDAFLNLTGYTREEVLGSNCRFLQGPDTKDEDIFRIKEALQGKKAINIDVVNYKKDGTSFVNSLSIRPLFSQDGELENFVGVQNQIT